MVKASTQTQTTQKPQPGATPDTPDDADKGESLREGLKAGLVGMKDTVSDIFGKDAGDALGNIGRKIINFFREALGLPPMAENDDSRKPPKNDSSKEGPKTTNPRVTTVPGFNPNAKPVVISTTEASGADHVTDKSIDGSPEIETNDNSAEASQFPEKNSVGRYNIDEDRQEVQIGELGHDGRMVEIIEPASQTGRNNLFLKRDNDETGPDVVRDGAVQGMKLGPEFKAAGLATSPLDAAPAPQMQNALNVSAPAPMAPSSIA